MKFVFEATNFRKDFGVGMEGEGIVNKAASMPFPMIGRLVDYGVSCVNRLYNQAAEDAES